MRLFPDETKLDFSRGFSRENDIFGRKPFGDQLTRIVCALEGPNVLLLDAPWGTGKSTFVKMWRTALTSKGIASIYFDAFANDYEEDAFLAIASQIIAEAQNHASRLSGTLTKFRTGALAAAKVLGRASVGAAIHAATAGVIRLEALEKGVAEVIKAFGNEAEKITDDVLKARLESHESDRKIFEEFRRGLAELAVALSSDSFEDLESDRPAEPKERPLVFIIDELDRCRPDFALKLLEKIKHFYSIPGMTFLLVSSLAQLKSAVRFAYGEVDAHTYLEKFYQLRILLPVGRPERPNLTASTYLNHLKCNEEIAQVIGEFSKISPLSLRTIERIVAYSNIILTSLPVNGLRINPIIAVLCIIRVTQSNLYEDLRVARATFAQINDLMRFNTWRSQYRPGERSPTSKNAEKWWRFALGELNDESEEQSLQQSLWNYCIEFSNLIIYYCELADGFAL